MASSSDVELNLGVDLDAIYALGNKWIAFGDTLAERADSMTGGVASMVWAGPAASAMQILWGTGDSAGASSPSDSGGPILGRLLQARDVAYEIGGAINYYADQVSAAVDKMKKEATLDIILQSLGLATMIIPFTRFGAAIFNAADKILSSVISDLTSVIARTAGLSDKAAMKVGGFVGGATSGGLVNSALQFIPPAIGYKIIGENWKPTPWDAASTVGLGAGMGGAFHLHGEEPGGGTFKGSDFGKMPDVGRGPNVSGAGGTPRPGAVPAPGGAPANIKVPVPGGANGDFHPMGGLGNGGLEFRTGGPTAGHADPSTAPASGRDSVGDGAERPNPGAPAAVSRTSGDGLGGESRVSVTPRPETAEFTAGQAAAPPPAEVAPGGGRVVSAGPGGRVPGGPGADVGPGGVRAVSPGPGDRASGVPSAEVAPGGGRVVSAGPGGRVPGGPGAEVAPGGNRIVSAGPGERVAVPPPADRAPSPGQSAAGGGPNFRSGGETPATPGLTDGARGGRSVSADPATPGGRAAVPASGGTGRPSGQAPATDVEEAGARGTGAVNGVAVNGGGGPRVPAGSPQVRSAAERTAAGDPAAERDAAVAADRSGPASSANGDPVPPAPARAGAGRSESGPGAGAAESVAGPPGARPDDGTAAAGKPRGDEVVPPARPADRARGRSASADPATPADGAAVTARGGTAKPSGRAPAGDVEDAGARDAGAVNGGATVNGGNGPRVPAANSPARPASERAAAPERDAVAVDRSGPAGSADGDPVAPASARTGGGRSESALGPRPGAGAAESVTGPAGARPVDAAPGAAKPRGDEAVPALRTGRTSPPKSPERPTTSAEAKAEGPGGGSDGSKVPSSEKPPSRTPGQKPPSRTQGKASDTARGITGDSAAAEDEPTSAVRSDKSPTGSVSPARTASEPGTPRDEHAAPAEEKRSDAGSPRPGSKDVAGDEGPGRSAVPRRDGPSAGPADDARSTSASPEGRGQDSATSAAAADRGEKSTGPSRDRDDSGAHGAQRPKVVEEAAALVVYEGPLDKAQTWQSFKYSRDADFAGRFSMEERFAHATRDLDVDHEVASAERRFREDTPDLAAHLPADGTAVRDVIKGFREDLHDSFSSAWEKSAGRPEGTDEWSKSYTRLRHELPERFAQVSLQHREIRRMETALNDAAGRFGEKDLFGGNYLPKERFEENAIKFDEVTETFSVDYEKAGPYGKLRLDLQKDVIETVNSAWRDAGGLPADEAARKMENDLGQIRAGLHERLEHLSNQERHVQHGERVLDQANNARENPLSGDGLDRVRKEFGDEIRSRYNELHQQAAGRKGWFDHAWEAADEHLRSTDALHNRLDYGEFREEALQQGRRALEKAVTRANGEGAGGDFGGAYVSPEAEERLTAEWTKAVEKAVDDHWSSMPGRDFRGTGPRESMRSSADDDAVSSRGSVRSFEETDDAGFHEGLRMSWEERFQQLSDTLPQRIEHEFDKSIVLRQAADDFERIAGHPDDLSAGHTVTQESFEKLSGDFRNDTVTEYDRLWGPEGTDTKAWLEHEAEHEGVFDTTVTALREAPFRPGGRGPGEHAEESAAGGTTDPRPPDDDTSGHAAPSSDVRPSPTAASADRPVPEAGARTAEPGRSDAGQVHAQAVRERPVSSSVRSPGSRKEGLGAGGAGETSREPAGERDLAGTPESSETTPSELVDDLTRVLTRVGEAAAVREQAYKIFQTQLEARYPDPRTRPAESDVDQVREWFANRWAGEAVAAGGSEHLTPATQERLRFALTRRLPAGTRSPADDRLQQRHEREFRVALSAENGTDHANPDPTWDRTTTELFHQRLDRIRERYVANRRPLGEDRDDPGDSDQAVQARAARKEQVEQLKQVAAKAATRLRSRMEPMGAAVRDFTERTRDLSAHAARDQALKRDPALFRWYRQQQADIVRRFSDALELHGLGARERLEHAFEQRITALRDEAWSRREANREFGRVVERVGLQELATPAARTWATARVEEARERFIQDYLDWRATVPRERQERAATAAHPAQPDAQEPASASAETSGAVDSPVVADHVSAGSEPARVEETRASASAETAAAAHSPAVARPALTAEARARLGEAQRHFIEEQRARIGTAIDRAARSFAQNPRGPLTRRFNVADGAASAPVLSAVRGQLQRGFDDLIARETSARKMLYPGTDSIDERIAAMKARINGPLDRLVRGIGWAIEREAAREASVAKARATVDAAASTWQTDVLAQSPALRDRLGVQATVPADVLRAVRDRFVVRAEARFDALFERDSENRTATAERSAEQLEESLKDDESLLHGWFLRPVAGRALVTEAARAFDRQFDAFDPGHEIDRGQLAGLRNAFTAHAGAVFESIFNGVTTDPAELTARIWEWEDRLNGLSGELADLVGFEPAPMEEPRAAAAPLHGLSDGHDVGTVAQDELSTKDRDDRASAGDVEAPMRELADVDAAREPLGQQSVVEVEAPARGAQDAGESKAGGPASADVAEQEVSDLGTARRLLGEQSEARYKQVMREARSIVRERSGQLPSMSDLDGAVSKIDRVRILTAAWIVREGVTRVAGDGRANEFVDSLLQIGTPASADGAEREGSDLDEGRRLLSKQPLAGYDAAMSAAREIIGARGGTSSERDPGGHVSDVNRAWILKQEQFTADVIALAAQEKVRLHSLPAEGREQLLAMAGQIIAHHHEPLPIDMTAVSAERRAKHEAVLQLVAGYMHDIAWTAVIRDKKTVDEAEAMAEASGDEMASLLADALGTRRRTGGAPPGGSRPPVDLVEIGGGGESSGAIRQRLDEDAAAEPPSYVDRPGSPDQVSDMAARWGIPLEQATRLSRYLWFDDELFESALAQAGLVGNATHMAEFVEEIGRIPYDLKMIARRLRPTVMGAREVYLVSRTFGMDPRYLKAFRGELGDLRPLPNESNLEEVRLYFENLLSSDQLARIGELCYRTGISVGDLKRFLDGQPQVQGENALTIGDLLALDVLDAFEWVDSQRFAHPSGAASAAGELEAAAAIVRGALPGELLESTPGAAAVAEGIPVGKISDGWYRDVLAQVHAVLSENDVDFDTRSRWARNRARRLVGLRDVSGAVGRAQGQGPNPSLVTSNETGRSFDQDMEEAAARVGIELEEFGAVLLQAVHNEGLGPDEVMRLPMDQLAHLTSETLEELRRETASIPGMSVADAAWIVEEFGVELEQFWVFGAQLRAIFGNSDLPLDGRMEQVREMFASLPGVRVEDGYIDITHFITIAVRAGISAEDLSALLVLGTYPGEEPELGEFLVIPRDDLREQVAEVLPHLRRAAEELAPMSLKDVAWVCVEGAVAPEDIWVFGRELRRIFLAVPGTDFSGMSQEEYRRQQVRDMFRAVPGALTEDGSIDVSAFAQMASHASVSADVLRAFLAWKGGYAKERSIALEDMDPDALSDEVDEYLTMLQEAAESLAPMSVDDVAWICAQTGIRPRDLKVFDRGLRGVYSRTPDTGPSHPDLESLRTGGLRAVLARPLEAFEVLRAYANMQDVAEFAAIAARLGIDADAMRAIVEAARHDMNLVRRVFRYELLDLVAEVRGTQSGGPSHTFDHSAWFEQARDTVQGLPERERLLAAAGEIVAAHHEPLPVDVTTVSTERRAQHEGVVYAVAERLHLLGYKADRAADGGVDHVVREAANALSRRLAVEFGTQRRTGGAPPGGFRPPVDLVEIGGGGASSGLRAGMAADRAGVLPAGMREGDLEWAGSSHSAGPFCVQVAVVGGDRLRGGRARRC